MHQKETELTWSGDDILEESEEEGSDEENLGDEAKEPVEEEENETGQNVRVREGRNRILPQYLNNYVTMTELEIEEDEVNMVEINATDPSTFEEA